MNEVELLGRTKQFALRIMKLVDALPRSVQGRTIANQVIRSGTSVAANYRAACKARSRAEFISKLGTVEEEADETAFWLELIIEGELLGEKRIAGLLQESREITAIIAIIAASRKSTARNFSKLQIANRKL